MWLISLQGVDDILIGTRRYNPTGSTKDLIMKHDREFRLVMEQLLKHRLVASYNKAQLFRAVVEFCGHMLSGVVRKPAPGKPSAVERWVRPTTGVRKLLLFLRQGVCGGRGTLTGLTEGEQWRW